MNRVAAIIGAMLLLSIVIVATILTALLYLPQRTPANPTTTIVVHPINVTTTSSGPAASSDKTQLIVMLEFPNGSMFDAGVLHAGTLSANQSNGKYLFPKIDPGTYPLSLKGTTNVYLSPTNLQLSAGLNYVNLTVYEMKTFVLYFNNGLSINGTNPGPSIIVQNSSAVQLEIINNTTLIHNLGVVMYLANENSSNILFNSLSLTLNAGGSTNETFIVTMPGEFYYEDLIGNHAHDGDYGSFYVLPSI